jgi:transcriptional regulator with XRE-family HTH domain
MTLEELIQKLIQTRKDLGLSQREVAKRAGLRQSMISEWETGTHEPKFRSLQAWAQALGLQLTAKLEDENHG